MSDTYKRHRRNLKANLAYYLQPGLSKARIKSFLFKLMPYKSDVPLVRIGGAADGGYLVPDVLDGLVACFSPGVSESMDFDMDMMNRGVPSFMADASVDGLVEDHPLATFDKLFIGPKTDGEFITLDDWVARYAPKSGDMILQMDIEGAEFTTLPTVSDTTLSRFRIVVLELHNMGRVFRAGKLAEYEAMMDKLLCHYTVVHTHVNNCAPLVTAAGVNVPPVLELTLLRHDFVKNAQLQTNLPHPLDKPNVPDREDYTLPSDWAAFKS
ncbi:FkbM family methyltransferase [Sulfitobacter sp. DFL-23]|uniref:FkbM family methyltransferase n=1 Tax=Sulfitobacter sp. DFL-23 TaxID=215829 RepID=UPI000DF2795B|nr:FkbM family methyltransferase [Sulfitobacter sp. DFL-23]